MMAIISFLNQYCLCIRTFQTCLLFVDQKQKARQGNVDAALASSINNKEADRSG